MQCLPEPALTFTLIQKGFMTANKACGTQKQSLEVCQLSGMKDTEDHRCHKSDAGFSTGSSETSKKQMHQDECHIMLGEKKRFGRKDLNAIPTKRTRREDTDGDEVFFEKVSEESEAEGEVQETAEEKKLKIGKIATLGMNLKPVCS